MANTTAGPADGKAAQDTSARDEASKKARDDAGKARADLGKLDQEATEARRKADAETDPARKAEAEKAAREAWQKADDARAKSAEADRNQRGAVEETSVADARTVAPVSGDTPAGAHHAQKFGNDPANPKHDARLPASGDTVRLSRKTPDHPELVYTDVHPDMVGDYLRAGWNRDDADALGRNAGATTHRTYQGKNVTVVRAAGNGDDGYDASKGDQVLVRFEDGTTRVAPRSELQKRELSSAA